jgi:hypothetical protein
MKYFFLAILFFFTANGFAQGWSFLEKRWFNFEAPFDTVIKSPIIDTSNHQNIWQIGSPHKARFDSAYSAPFAIVTDTANSYPVNDTSVFIIKAPEWHTSPFYYWLSGFSFHYKLDIDSGEIAKVEVSGDSLIWKTVTDTSFTKPDTSWRKFEHEPFQYGWGYDTLLIRFTFISDSIQTNKDGWIIDNFIFGYFYTGINDISTHNLFRIFPNPSNGNLKIETNSNKDLQVAIHNLNGICVYACERLPTNGQLQLNLPDGIYFVRCFNDEKSDVQKLLIRR